MHGFPDNFHLYHQLVQSAFGAWGVALITRHTQLAKIEINAGVFIFGTISFLNTGFYDVHGESTRQGPPTQFFVGKSS
jgi:hypothetical protein